MNKYIKTLHRCLACIFGIFILTSCITGALLVFENEITEWVHSDRYRIEVPDTPVLPIDQLIEHVTPTLAADVSITGVTLSSDPSRSYQFLLSKPRKAALCVNPYTGEVLGAKERLPFYQTVIRLHRWFMGQRPADGAFGLGRWVMGLSTTALILLVLSGIWMARPRLLSKIKHPLRIHFNKGTKRFCYEAHVLGGTYLAIFLLLRALTGLNWSFPAYRAGIYSAFGTAVETKKSSDKKSRQPNYAVWQQALDHTRTACGEYRQLTITDGKAAVSNVRFGNLRATDDYRFDKSTGEITTIVPASEQPLASRLKGWIYTIHTGASGGIYTRILTLLTVVLGASLPFTGFYLWRKRK